MTMSTLFSASWALSFQTFWISWAEMQSSQALPRALFLAKSIANMFSSWAFAISLSSLGSHCAPSRARPGVSPQGNACYHEPENSGRKKTKLIYQCFIFPCLYLVISTPALHRLSPHPQCKSKFSITLIDYSSIQFKNSLIHPALNLNKEESISLCL